MGARVRARYRPSGATVRPSRGDSPRNLVPGSVEDFRFIEPQVYAFADPQAAVAQVKAEGLIKPTRRIYRQEYVVFLRAAGEKIAYLREYFDPTRAAKSLDAPILDLEPWF